MYKDVWKKFGAKVLIVLCSVLLVGGVAIAVPVLRAAPPKKTISLSQVFIDGAADNPQTPVSGAALKIVNRFPVKYSVGPNGDVDTQKPRLEIQFADGDKWQISEGTDYILSVAGITTDVESANELRKAGTHKVGIRSGVNSESFLEDSKVRYFDYTVEKASLDDGFNYSAKYTSNGDGYANSRNIKVSVNGKEIDTSDYTVSKQPRPYSKDEAIHGVPSDDMVSLEAGQKQMYINLRNFTKEDDSGIAQDYIFYSYSLKKNINDLNPSASYNQASGKVVVSINDISYSLRENTDYTVINTEEGTNADGNRTEKVTIEGLGNYEGEWTSPEIEVPQASEKTIRLAWNSITGKEGIKGTYDYDIDLDGRTYQISKEQVGVVWNEDDETEQFYPSDYTIEGCCIVGSQSSTATVLKGRTAGLVRMKLRLDGGYVGYIYYNVKQDIETAKITILNAVPEDAWTYDGTQRVKNPVITFTDMNGDTSDPLTIGETDAEFKVHYWLEKDDTREEINKDPDKEDTNSKRQARSYAGTVHMDVYPQAKSGYYGSLKGNEKLEYEVEPKSVDDAKATGELSLRFKEYGQTTAESTILNDAKIMHIGSDGTKTQVSEQSEGKKGTTFTWYYINSEGEKTTTGWNRLAAGKYTLQCVMTGNHKGTVSTQFEIRQYDEGSVIKGIAKKCDTDDTDTCQYNEEQHRPKVSLSVEENGTTIVLNEGTDFTVRYKDNVYATEKAKALIFYAGNRTDTPDLEMEFEIDPRTIKEDANKRALNLSFVANAEEGFQFDAGLQKFTYPYNGNDGRPSVEELEYGITYNSNPKSLSMLKDTDYILETDSAGKAVLYGENGQTVKNPVNTNTDYYVKVTPQGNFKAELSGDYVLAGPFRFAKRSLAENKADIDFNPKAMPYDNKDWTLVQIEQWIKKNITVTDNGVSPARNLAADEYEITIDASGDKRNVDGTIEFKITAENFPNSMYTDSMTGILNVGRNIAETEVREYLGSSDFWNAFNGSNQLTLTKNYSLTGSDPDDPYGLRFGETTGNNTNLYFNGRENRNRLTRQAKEGEDAGEYRVGLTSSPDYTGDGLASVTLYGVNGYYGEVTIKIRIQQIDFNDTDYEIVFTNERIIYDGTKKEPKNFKVINKVTGEEISSDQYTIKKYERNEDANEQYGDDLTAQQTYWAKITIEGRAGYAKELVGYFKIEQRQIDNGSFGMHTDFSFEEGRKNSTLEAVDYVPECEFYDGKLKGDGGWSDILLYYFRPDPAATLDLKWDKDYVFYCTGTELTDDIRADILNRYQNGSDRDTNGLDRNYMSDANAGTAWAVIKGKGNYKGVIIKEYEVNKVSFDDETDDSTFSVSAGNEWQLFTGNEITPNISVTQIRNGKISTLVEGTDYEIEYGPERIFLSRDYDNDANKTYITVNGKNNYKGQMLQRFVIFDQLTKENTDPFNIGANLNSKLNYEIDTETNTRRIRYNKNINELYSYANLGLHLLERKTGSNFNDPDLNGEKRSDDYHMELMPAGQTKGDYTVNTASQSTVGTGTIRIKGTCVRNQTGLIEGDANIPVTIWESLNTIDGTSLDLWKKNYGSRNITVTGSSITVSALEQALQEKLYIFCGGRELRYGDDEDYVIDRTSLDTNIGTGKTVRIIPSAKAKREKYLEDDVYITFDLTASISGAEIGRPIESIYVYNHGTALVNSNQNLLMVLNGTRLENGRDYKITIRNQETNEVIDAAIVCGNYSYVVEGMGNYGGSLGQGEFRIIPYDLGKNKDKVSVTLRSERVTFTGKPVWPQVTEVTINTGNTSVPLTDPNLNGGDNFFTKEGSKGDNTNWTDVDNGEEQPVVEIHGKGNYTGFVEKPYYIVQKNITDGDIDIEEIVDQTYNNNEPVKPYPHITYLDKNAGEGEGNVLMVLNGLEDSVSKDYSKWKEYGTHFIYEYEGDVRTAGEKVINLRGVGNFTGTASIKYIVKALPLDKTKLTFMSEELPVYDSKQHKPAFKLSYGNVDSILIFRDGKVVSTEYLKDSNVEVTFKNNIDASTEEKKASVTVKIVAGSTANYEGEVTKEFTILPAPIENHVRFMYRPKGASGDADLSTYKLSFPFKAEGQPVYPKYASADAELAEEEIGMYYNFPKKANHGKFLVPGTDVGSQDDPDGFSIEYKYVEPDTEDTDIRDKYDRPTPDWAGKVRVTVTGKGNYTGKAKFWYFIGDDISSDAKISISPTTAVFNSLNQYPKVTITGIDEKKCDIGNYRGEVSVENLITKNDFIDADTYYIRVEGNPSKGTYATKPETLKFTITPRALSNSLVIDGFKKEYSYTGYEIRPVGISVTDYIDNIKYRLTEDEDYVLSYSNNLNVGIAYINVKGQGNFSGSAATNFLITSSTISSGGINGSNSFLDGGSGEISGTVPVSPNNVNLTMDTSDAMYYTGKAVYPKVSISGMTENIDYTVTFSNNVEVGIGVATINGIGNNNGVITKNFRIIAPLSKCTISPIPAQQYTGSAVTPSITVRCGNTVLMEGTDYAVSYANNINIGTATVTIRALNNANYTGTATAKFSIGNDVGGFIISGYAPSYAYTGNAITPGVVVETGSSTLTLGTDYTVSYSNNVNSGTATITVTGIGKYSGTQTANFIIEGKNIQSCDTTEVADRTYTGDAYTPDITVSDGGKVLKNGVDYTVTYTNNTNPGTASIIIQGVGSNYTGTKVISFKISAVAVKGLKASSVKYNSIKLKWTKQEYADGYQVCDSNSKVVKTVKTNSATITGLSAAKTYKYKVRSYVRNSDGTKSYGTFSSVLSTTTKLKTPTVKVVSNAKGQARISWSKVSRATGYEIYYKKSAKAKYKKLKTVNNANIRVCKVRGMNSGDRAYFRVRAFRKSGSKKIYSALNPLKVITVK